MYFQKKLGLGFILFGTVAIALAYILMDGGGFVFSALVGVLAICFGAFQLMLANAAPAAKTSAKHSASKSTKAKKSRH